MKNTNTLKSINYIFSLALIFSISIGYSQKKLPNDTLQSLYEFVFEKPQYVLNKIDSFENTFKGEYYFDKGLCYQIKGQAYFTLGNYEKVYENYTKGVNYAKSIDNYILAGDYYSLFSDVYVTLEKWDKVTQNLDLAMEMYLKGGYNEGVIQLKQSKAINYKNQGLYQKSIDILLEEEPSYKNLDNASINIFGLYSIAYNYLELNNKSKADVYLNKLKKLKNTFGDVDPKFHTDIVYDYYWQITKFDLANYYHKSKNPDSSLYHLSRLNNDFLNKNLELKLLYYEMNMDTYSSLGEQELYNLYKDSLLDIQMEKSNTQLNENIVLIDDVIEVNKHFNDEKKSTKALLKITIITLILISALILLMFILKRKYKKIESDKSNEIKIQHSKLKNQEKISIQLKSKEKSLSEIKSDLKDVLKTSDIDKQKQKVKTLFSKMNTETTINSKNNFEELHSINPSFFINISKKHPSLHQTDQVICYYIFMKFKNKEIAYFLNLSERAIEGKRYRIRNKIDPTKEGKTLLKAIKAV